MYTITYIFQLISLKSIYEPFNIEMVGPNVFMTSNMTTYAYCLIVFKFKLNFRDKYYVNDTINQ